MPRRLLLPLILIPIAALVVVLPLIVHGCSCGHDFDFHLVSWMEAAAQFKAGVWHPAWAFSPAWNAGEPRFVFYPPLSWTLGALLGMALPWGAVPVVYTWLAIATSGFAMYRLANELTGVRRSAAPAIAAVMYMANPYMLFTAYERTAYAELLAAAWIPLLLATILRERVTALRIAMPVALLWLTNAPAAVMGCYALALLAAVRVGMVWRTAGGPAGVVLALRVTASVALGLGLAAFYIVPAAYERRWVQIAMTMVSGMRIGDNFLFHHTGDAAHDEVLRTASSIAVTTLSATATVLAAVWLRLRREPAEWAPQRRHTAMMLAGLALVMGLLLTPVSAAVWRVAPEMAFLQFPWRLTAILAAVLCAAVALLAQKVRPARTMVGVVAFVLVAAISLPAMLHFRQGCDEEDTVAARLAVFLAKTGTDPTDEYTPGEADNDALQHANPPFWLAEGADAQPLQGRPGQAPMHFDVEAAKAEYLILNRRDYPAWQVKRNGERITDKLDRADGLIAFAIPAGSSHIDIAYARTGDVALGEAVSFAALCGAFGIAMLERIRRRSSIIIA